MRRTKVKLDIYHQGVDSTPETEGYEFTICGHAFVVHRTIPEQRKSEKGWSVTEPLTGTSVIPTPKPTRESAVAYATKLLEEHGASKIAHAIRRQQRRAEARKARTT